MGLFRHSSRTKNHYIFDFFIKCYVFFSFSEVRSVYPTLAIFQVEIRNLVVTLAWAPDILWNFLMWTYSNFIFDSWFLLELLCIFFEFGTVYPTLTISKQQRLFLSCFCGWQHCSTCSSYLLWICFCYVKFPYFKNYLGNQTKYFEPWKFRTLEPESWTYQRLPEIDIY